MDITVTLLAPATSASTAPGAVTDPAAAASGDPALAFDALLVGELARASVGVDAADTLVTGDTPTEETELTAPAADAAEQGVAEQMLAMSTFTNAAALPQATPVTVRDAGTTETLQVDGVAGIAGGVEAANPAAVPAAAEHVTGTRDGKRALSQPVGGVDPKTAHDASALPENTAAREAVLARAENIVREQPLQPQAAERAGQHELTARADVRNDRERARSAPGDAPPTLTDAASADPRPAGERFARVEAVLGAGASSERLSSASYTAVPADIAPAAQAAAPSVHPATRDAMAPAHALHVGTPVGAPGWDTAVAHRVVWLAGRDTQSAELHLNPPELGPVAVTLNITQDQASALFVSPHAAVRDAIEAALPKLREMLSDNGIALGNAQVSAETPRGQGEGDGQAHGRESGRSDARARTLDVSVPVGRASRGLVDTFA